jgi:hypothetical protein
LTGNSARGGGGAADNNSGNIFAPHVLLNHCLVSGNSGGSAGGGGAAGGILNNCALIGNSVPERVYVYGGGANAGTLNNCVLAGNSAWGGGGAAYATLNNCLVVSNFASQFGGGAMLGALNNCTIVSNTAEWEFGGISLNLDFADGYEMVANNCIICSNFPQDYSGSSVDPLVNYSCIPSIGSPTPGVGNITNLPLFVDFAGGNFRLQSNSPCINAGNNAYVVGATDLDGNPRISGGTVDMGAYEFQNPASIISYAWLQQYGLPTDGSADYADSDGNGMKNWQKWVAGLNPTNAASVLQVLSPMPSGTNLVVTWQSVTNINYFLQRSSSLAPGSFQPLATNLPGWAGVTTYIDSNAPAPGPWYYRVGVP